MKMYSFFVRIILIFCLTLFINLITIFTFGAGGKRTYKGTYKENNIAVDNTVNKEPTVDEAGIIKEAEEKLQKEPSELPHNETFEKKQYFQSDTTKQNSRKMETGINKEDNTGTTSIKIPVEGNNIIRSDHLPLGSEYKMKEEYNED